MREKTKNASFQSPLRFEESLDIFFDTSGPIAYSIRIRNFESSATGRNRSHCPNSKFRHNDEYHSKVEENSAEIFNS